MKNHSLTVLVIGRGGREMAMIKALLNSPSVKRVIAAPGSDAVAELASCFPVAETDISGLLKLAREEACDLTVVGPEVPLTLGIADQFQAAGLRIFAPTAKAARIESSKAYAKDLMVKAGVPTAGYRVFTERHPLLQFLNEEAYPLVLKQNGLCAGKGVSICHTLEDALRALEACPVDEEHPMLVEEFLEGYEFSLIALACGESFVCFPAAQDHKSIFEDNKGPNTGGMGAVSPVPRVSADLLKAAEDEVIRPTLQALKADGCPFTGFLYAGLMVTAKGLRVIEFNARFGDPEAEVILPRIESDFCLHMLSLLEGVETSPIISPQTCLGVVLSAPGYPGKVTEHPLISEKLIAEAAGSEDLDLIHMGSRKTADGRWQANGGRVVMLCCLGSSVGSCRTRIYEVLGSALQPSDPFHFRKDIGCYAE